jgi:hypothetical protein
VDVRVQPADLLVLLGEVDLQEVAKGHDTEEAVAGDHRQVPAAGLLHLADAVLVGILGGGHDQVLGHDLARLHAVGIATGGDDTAHDVALGEDPGEARAVEHGHGPDAALRHVARDVADRVVDPHAVHLPALDERPELLHGSSLSRSAVGQWRRKRRTDGCCRQ